MRSGAVGHNQHFILSEQSNLLGKGKRILHALRIVFCVSTRTVGLKLGSYILEERTAIVRAKNA